MTFEKDMEIENHVRLKILSKQHTPDQLEKMVGVKGDRSWLAGEFRNKTTIKEKMNGWLIESKLDRKSTRLNSSHTDISRMPSSA